MKKIYVIDTNILIHAPEAVLNIETEAMNFIRGRSFVNTYLIKFCRV